MKIIQSHDVQSKLMNVILTAQRELVMVSPYVNLTHTKQVSAALVAAQQKGVQIDFYIRDDAHTNSHISKQQVLGLGITPRLIPNLHAKLYFNESTGIIASLNLLSSSIGNSIEIGGQLETPAEVAELRLFVAQFITPHEIGAPVGHRQPPVSDSPPVATAAQPPAKPLTEEEKRFHQEPFGEVLAKYLSDKVDRRCKIEGNHALLSIRAVGNTFSMRLDHSQDAINHLVLQGIVSKSEADRFAAKASAHFQLETYTYVLKRGGTGCYDQVQAVRRANLSAPAFNDLSYGEKRALLFEIAHFLLATQSFKADYGHLAG